MDSSLAYQGGARGIGIENVLEINMFATEGTFPNLTLLFDIKPEDGLERIKSNDELVVMTTKHCIRYANNICSKEIGKPATSLYLINDKGRFRLDFDCRNCCMKVIREK